MTDGYFLLILTNATVILIPRVQFPKETFWIFFAGLHAEPIRQIEKITSSSIYMTEDSYRVVLYAENDNNLKRAVEMVRNRIMGVAVGWIWYSQ